MIVKHHFNDGLYTKESHFAAGEVGQKHVHSYDHESELVEGIAIVFTDGIGVIYAAPRTLTVKAGVQHGVMAITPIVWLCKHKTECTDPQLIDQHLVETA